MSKFTAILRCNDALKDVTGFYGNAERVHIVLWGINLSSQLQYSVVRFLKATRYQFLSLPIRIKLLQFIGIFYSYLL